MTNGCMTNEFQAIIPAPFGALGVRVVNGNLVGTDFLPSGTPLLTATDDATRSACYLLSTYLSDATTPLQIPLQITGTVFQQRVWQALRTIPVGVTWTYAELAERVGSGPRAVANACGANHIPIVIPCHRVVAKNGLGGFMQGRETGSLNIKQWLLDHERRKPVAAG